MNESREQWALRVLSGEDRSARAALLRGVLSVAEPFYAAVILARNALYDAGVFKSHRLPRPTISVGNLTTGGTGKTPVVKLLAEKLIQRKLRPAILMRGYRSAQTGGSDEQLLLQHSLGDAAIVIANPDRVAGATAAIQHAQPPDVFILDDGFQHRRVKRDYDIVLIDATNPFGHNHVLPRGLMREPKRGLARADGVVVTHLPDIDATDVLYPQITRENPNAWIVFAEHIHVALVTSSGEELPIEKLRSQHFHAFAGIANPQHLERQLQQCGSTFTGLRAFPDHHAYSPADLNDLDEAARSAGASCLVTTEKDWVKIARLGLKDLVLPIYRLKLEMQFPTDAAERLIELILGRLKTTSSSPPAASAAASAPAA